MIGRIYKITSSNTDKIYIGSTTKKLTERLLGHEYNYKKFKNGKMNNVKSFEILEKKHYKIQLLEKIEYETKRELLEREGYYIRKYRDICVNKCVAGRTLEQYYRDNADKLREASKQYRIDNTDKIEQYKKDNMVKIKEQRSEKLECACGGRFTRHNKIQHTKSKKHIAFNNQ